MKIIDTAPPTAFTILGHDRREAIVAEQLETFPTPPGCDRITFVSDELTSFCPVTGQPDFYTLRLIVYNPKRCIESKSLKLYLQSFREARAFAETLAAEIANSIVAHTGGGVSVDLEQQVRGGLRLTASASAERREEV